MEWIDRAIAAKARRPPANGGRADGIRILARSIEEPLRQIVENAGDDAAVDLQSLDVR